MNRDTEIKVGSTIYDLINASRMSPAERQVAINAMEDAEMLVSAFEWMVRKVEQLGAFLFLKPGIRQH